MRWVALIGLSACNQVYGLTPTQSAKLVDAQYFDAPTDAPYACPVDGSPPVFSPLLHQVLLAQPCTSYTLSQDANLALASCVGSNTTVIEQGPIDQPLVPSVINSIYANMYNPVLSPEGDKFYANYYDSSLGGYRFVTLIRQPDGSWIDGVVQSLPFPAAGGIAYSAPTRGPNRHMMVFDFSTYQIHDVVESSADTWTDVHVYGYAELGISAASTLSLTEDGLRLLLKGVTTTNPYSGTLYSYRASIASSFPPVVPLATVPPDTYRPVMTVDCARVYFSGVGTVLYVQQQ